MAEHERKLRGAIAKRVNDFTPREFQEFCKTLLENVGYQDVQVGQPGPDEGVDGEAKQKGVIDTVIKFQAKKWANPVGRPEIDKFRGAIQGKCHRGILITTSRFTEDARQAAMTVGGVPIEMIDGEQILNLIIEKRIGVREDTISLLRLA